MWSLWQKVKGWWSSVLLCFVAESLCRHCVPLHLMNTGNQTEYHRTYHNSVLAIVRRLSQCNECLLIGCGIPPSCTLVATPIASWLSSPCLAFPTVIGGGCLCFAILQANSGKMVIASTTWAGWAICWASLPGLWASSVATPEIRAGFPTKFHLAMSETVHFYFCTFGRPSY